MAEESTLGKIINMVVSPEGDTGRTEVYVATNNGEYGCFMVGGEPSRDLQFRKMTVEDYISQTQHLITSGLVSSKGSRKL